MAPRKRKGGLAGGLATAEEMADVRRKLQSGEMEIAKPIAGLKNAKTAVDKFRRDVLLPAMKVPKLPPEDVRLQHFRDAHLPQWLKQAKIDPLPKHKSVCIQLLGYDAKNYIKTTLALIAATQLCAQRGWEVCFMERCGDSMVSRGRSHLASQFLQHPETQGCTDLFLIDTDLAFNPADFIRLLEHPVDIVAGCYPYKNEEGNFPLRWRPDGLFEENGLWIVQGVTPGFLRITRRALERITMELGPALEFKDNLINPATGFKSYMFFDNLRRPNGIYDEGYVLCEYWRMCGGQVWVDPDCNITHIGIKEYNFGTVREWVDRKYQEVDKLYHEQPHIPPLILRKQISRALAPEDTYENYGATW